MLDALASEPQFLDHLAPLWRAIPVRYRGRFLVEPQLVPRSRILGIGAVGQPRPPRTPAYPPPRHDGAPLLVASYGDIKVGRRLGYGPFVFLEHGAGQSYAGDPAWRNDQITASYPGGPDRADVDLFLVPNEHAAARWQAAYPSASVAIVGSPRLETLPDREPGPGPVVAISFHWQTPHRLGPEAQNALGDYQAALPDLAAAFTVIGHAHPKGDWPRIMARVYERAGIRFVADFVDVCRLADLYVCDNSTTIFEFAATGRPVVLLNSRWYRRHINHGLRFWDAAHVGLQVDRPEQLIPTVREALRDPPRQRAAREDALRIVYSRRSGGAKQGAQAVVRYLRDRTEAAA